MSPRQSLADRRRPRGLVWILFANIVVAVDYSMIMPTGFEYIYEMGGDELYYGATVAIFPCGRILLLLLVGHLSDRYGFRLPFLFGTCLCVIGDFVYGTASMFGHIWIAPLGRFIAGCGATQPLSAWAARSYPPHQRVLIESMQKAASLIGVVIGPALNGLIVSVDTTWGPFLLNPRTLAGFVPGLLNLILVFGFLFGVDLHPPALPRDSISLISKAGEVTVEDPTACQRLTQTGAWLCLLVAFHTNIQMSAIDTIIAPLTSENLGWDLFSNSLLFAVIAVICFFGAASGMIANRLGATPLYVIFIGSVTNALCAAVMTTSLAGNPDEVNMRPFLFAGALVAFSILFYGGAAGGLYQQACGNQQGLLGGLYTMAFSLGRPVGSMLGGLLLQGYPTALCVVVPTGVSLACCVQWFVWRRLQKTEELALGKADVNDVAIVRSNSSSSVLPP